MTRAEELVAAACGERGKTMVVATLKDHTGYAVARVEGWAFDKGLRCVIRIQPETLSIANAMQLRDWLTEMLTIAIEEPPEEAP